MEAIFYNKTLRNKKILKAYISSTVFRKSLIPNLVFIIIMLGFAAWILVNAICAPWDQSFYLFLEALILAMLFALVPHIAVWFKTWKGHRAYLRHNGSDSDEMEFFFEPECMRRRVTKKQEEASFSYDVISEVIDTKKHYFIVCSTRIFMLDKQNFLQGEQADFVPFLRTKAPDARFTRA